jgi:hypothetical protein
MKLAVILAAGVPRIESTEIARFIVPWRRGTGKNCLENASLTAF